MSTVEHELSDLHRLSSSNAEPDFDENIFLHERPRERTCSVVRRFTVESLPSQSSLNTFSAVRSRSTAPLLFIYAPETYTEQYVESIADIRVVRQDECLWLDVTHVSRTPRAEIFTIHFIEDQQ
jgi:hypothetical protein